MSKTVGMLLLFLATAGLSLGAWVPVAAPEIDPGSAGSAVAFVTGALLVIRSRRAS